MVVARAQLGTQEGALLAVKPADLLMSGGLVVFAVLAGFAHSAGWEEAVALFLLLALAPLALRVLSQHWHWAGVRIAADFFPTVSIVAAYNELNPVCDFFRQPMADLRLQHVDQQLFGLQPAVALAPHLTPVLNDVLMFCYCSYYFWPFALGIALYLREGEGSFDRWCTAVCASVLLNWALYFAVPAAGPRFSLAGAFPGPIEGRLAAPLSQAFMVTPFHRDCFPSGHTALTLLVLTHAWRKLRPFFWVALPFGVGLIISTVALRFHYGVDLLAAPPLMIVAYALSERFYRAAPQGWTLLQRR